MSDGAEFSIDLGVKGGEQAVSAADALAALASKLELAGSAATAASDAMKVGQTAYNQAETGADRAAKALEKIGHAADAQKVKLAALAEGNADGVVNVAAYQKAADKLTQLNARQAEAAAKSQAANTALAAEAASLDKLKSAAATAADNEAKLNKQHTEAAKAAKEAEKATKGAGDAAGGSAFNFRALGAGLGKLGGPLGSVGSAAAGVGGAMQKLGKSLGAAGPYVAAAVLAVALAAAFVVATLAITKFAVESADAARTSALLSDGIAGSVKGGRALDDAIDRLGNTVPQSREELLAMAGDLAKTGLRGEELSNKLEETAIAAAKLKWGPDFAKQMLALPNQAAKLKANFANLFNGLNIEALLQGLSTLVALFDKNSASANAIKVVFESMFQPVIDGLTGLIPKAVSTFIQFEILALKAAIALKPHVSILKDIGYGFLVLGAVCVAAVGIIIAVLLAAVAVPALLIAAFLWLQDTSFALGQAIRAGIGSALDWLSDKFNAVVEFLSGLSLSEIGTQLIQGLIDGLKAAGAGVLTAITGIASGAVDAAKKALGIASPSKIFAEIGMHTAAGMEQGVDAGADGVQSSMTDMVAPPAVGKAGSGKASATGSAGGNIFYVYLTGGDTAEANRNSFAEFFEGISAQDGSAVPNGV